MKNSFQDAEARFREHHGLLRAGQARRLGISGATIAEMTAAGLLVKESRGVYRLASSPTLAYSDLVTVALRIPYGVVCLISALSFFELTSQIPHRVYVALPKDQTKAPRLDYPPLQVVTLSRPAYAAGIEVHTLDHVPVKFYDKEKTIADCFKFRNLVGRDVALEALKMYFAEHRPQIGKLLDYARLDRVEKIMRPYLELYQ